ncbi:MAG TPA: M14 family zinc carboxypeptidase [Xanthobacteraceae bacterium]|nr:M14 family zinc carboxypeptidase [Xanthobacteraceae bacterium]
MRRSLLLFAFLAFADAAAAQELDRGAEYRQNAAVLARYPDVPMALDTPALAPGRTDFTSQAEMEAYLAALKVRVPALVLGSLGRSAQGRDIPYLVFTKEGLTDAAAIVALGRPILWFIGLQHGNEPAGGDAMLALAARLADGALTPALDHVTVVVVPRANPDGAALFTRATARGADLNRDHILLTLPESAALHAKLVELPPDVVIDGHEFSVANRWLQKFAVIEASDAMFLYATHPMVHPAITALADGVFRPALEAAWKAHGVTSFWYHTTSYRPDDKLVSMGGNAPGIARNAFGLMGAVSFLIETRGVGVGMQAFQRRVATHVLAAEAVIATAAADPRRLHEAVLEARRASAAAHGDLVVAHRLAVEPVDLPMLDPETARERPTTVPFRDSRAVTATAKRARPAGYVLLGEAVAAADRLALDTIAVCAIAVPASIAAEAFILKGAIKRINRESINPDQSVEIELAPKILEVPAGTLFVPMRQPAAAIAAAALEPDSPGSFIGTGVIAMPAGSNEAPIYRAEAAAARGLRLTPRAGATAPCETP